MAKPPKPTTPDPRTHDATPAEYDAAVRRANHIAKLLDQQFRLPGTSIRFGYDSIIGLIPVVGDTATAIVSAYLVAEAVRLRIGKFAIFKMTLNIIIDWLLGLIPGADIILDVAFKSNVRNAKILAKALKKRETKKSS